MDRFFATRTSFNAACKVARCRLIGLFWILTCTWSSTATAEPAPPRPKTEPPPAAVRSAAEIRVEHHKRLLAENRITLTQDGLDTYFQDHKVRLAEVRKVAPQLGSNRFAERDQATRSLMALPTVPRALLKQLAKDSNDPEVRRRIDLVLDRSTHKPDHETFPRRSICHAILGGLIATKPGPSKKGERIAAAEHVQKIVRHHGDLETLSLASGALGAVEINEAQLTEWIKPDAVVPEPSRLQLVALPTVVRQDRENWLPKMKQWSDELQKSGQDERAFFIRLQRLNLGEEAVVSELIESLRSPDVATSIHARQYAKQALQQACNQPNRSIDPTDWRVWLAKQPRPLKLHLPVRIEFASFETFFAEHSRRLNQLFQRQQRGDRVER